MPEPISIETSEREHCEKLVDFFANEYGNLTDEGKAVAGIMLTRRLGDEMRRVSKKLIKP